jgi:hypothetical protein
MSHLDLSGTTSSNPASSPPVSDRSLQYLNDAKDESREDSLKFKTNTVGSSGSINVSGTTSSDISSDCFGVSDGEAVPYIVNFDDVSLHLTSMITAEGKTLPNADFFDGVQNGRIKPVWRRQVVVWMTSFTEEYSLSPYTVSTAVNYLDRYLSARVASHGSLMPLAATCLFIASKFHDVDALCLDDLVALRMNYGPFSASFFISLETSIIKSLNWNLHPVVSHRVAAYFLLVGKLPEVVKTQVNAALDLGK